MDTTEQVNGYYFSGLSNITASELFFWVFLDETGRQVGAEDFTALALIVLGQPMRATRAKPIGATKGTSTLSYYLRQWLTTEVDQWPTLTNGSISRLKFSYVTNLGAFVGRWLPFVGWAILAEDVAIIAYKATNRYNLLVKESDRLW
ncbi:STM2901 family protein [Buttiauxella brennerae]|uniref:STM2901 family protein n=1 Tax=Buttiauxella brennerae TaxID=82988 RepID=UPI00286F244E|nr:hypothetical protein [Buttiauxella brennerae]